MLTIPEDDELAINVEFLKGHMILSSNDYFDQCMNALEWSFSKFLIREEVMSAILKAAFLDIYSYVSEKFPSDNKTSEKFNYNVLREIFSLDTVPFRYTKKKQLNIHDLAKEDERKLVFEALLLFILRVRIPNKYSSEEEFFNDFPHAKERTVVEQQRQFHTANWMDLMFYTICPRHNKSLILNIITRIVEGRDARYITGSGQTRPTNDRVLIYSTIGECEKIPRPPRQIRKEKEIANLEALKRQYQILKNQVDRPNQLEEFTTSNNNDNGKSASSKRKLSKMQEPEQHIFIGSESLMRNSENIQRLKIIVDSIIAPETEVEAPASSKVKRGRKPKSAVVASKSSTSEAVVEQAPDVVVNQFEQEPINESIVDTKESGLEVSDKKEVVDEAKKIVMSTDVEGVSGQNLIHNLAGVTVEAAEPPVKRRRRGKSTKESIEEPTTKKVVNPKAKETRGRKPKVSNVEIPEVFDMNNANYNYIPYPYMFQNLPDYLSSSNGRDRNIDSPVQLPSMQMPMISPYVFPSFPNYFYPNMLPTPADNNQMAENDEQKKSGGDSEQTSLKTSTTTDTTLNETTNAVNPWYIDPTMQFMYPQMLPPFLYPNYMYPPSIGAMPMIAGMHNNMNTSSYGTLDSDLTENSSTPEEDPMKKGTSSSSVCNKN